MPLSRVEIKNLYKIFGSNAAVELAKGGASASDIRQRTGAVVAVHDVNLTILPGEIFVVMGLSGSGKSTLIRCINRLIEPSAGQVLIDGEDTTQRPLPSLREVRRHRVTMVFQNFALLPHRTVLENAEYGLAIRKENKVKRRERALEALQLVGLKQWADRYPDNLSGGMKQRVGLARALATECDILLMDEPFSALDPLIRRELQDELIRLQSSLSKTIIFVTHDIQEATRIGNRIALMRDGSVVQVGTPQEIVMAPADGYVASFSRDLDRGQLLRAIDVMRPLDPSVEGPRQRIPSDRRIVDLYSILAADGQLTIVNDNGDPVGILRSDDVFRQLSLQDKFQAPSPS